MSFLLRRFAFGSFSFEIFWIVPLTTGGGIPHCTASQPATTQTVVQPGKGVMRPVGVAASVEFRERGGWRVALGAVLPGAADTFTAVLPGTRRK